MTIGIQKYHGIFACHPSDFRFSRSIALVGDTFFSPAFVLTNKGFRLKTDLHREGVTDLNCRDGNRRIGIYLYTRGGGVYIRTRHAEFGSVDPEHVGKTTRKLDIYIIKSISSGISWNAVDRNNYHPSVLRRGFEEAGELQNPFKATVIEPREDWDPQRRRILSRGALNFTAFVYFTPQSRDWGEPFILVFGETEGRAEPWCTIETAGDYPKDLADYMTGDLQILGAMARDRQ